MVKKEREKLRAERIARTALMGAVLFVSQAALAFLPNIEIVTLLIVIFARRFGREAAAACFVYVCLTALSSGFGVWWAVYLVIWPAFSLLAYALRRIDSWALWAVINGAFGLFFGAFFALAYLPYSRSFALSYWISGIPWDITHCIGNFFVALLLGRPLDAGVKRISNLIER